MDGDYWLASRLFVFTRLKLDEEHNIKSIRCQWHDPRSQFTFPSVSIEFQFFSPLATKAARNIKQAAPSLPRGSFVELLMFSRENGAGFRRCFAKSALCSSVRMTRTTLGVARENSSVLTMHS